MTHESWLPRVVALLCLAASTTAAVAAQDPSVPTYSAVYDVEYNGKNAGSSEFKVTYDAASDTYEFTSSTRVKGMLKLALPNPAIERSLFRVVDGRIRPVESWYEDGSRKGEDNLHVAFDWERRVAIVAGDGDRREVALDDRALDRASIQVAMMRDMIVAQKIGDYRLADEDAAQTYIVTDNGEAQTETGVGRLATRAITRQREGSSRSTSLWFAPQLSYLPVRIETRRNGEVQSALRLVSVAGLGGATPAR